MAFIIVAGRKTVTTAGSPEQMPDVAVMVENDVTIKALDTNTGSVYISDSSANAGNSNKRFSLTAGQSVSVNIDNLNALFINSDVNGEGIEYITER